MKKYEMITECIDKSEEYLNPTNIKAVFVFLDKIDTLHINSIYSKAAREYILNLVQSDNQDVILNYLVYFKYVILNTFGEDGASEYFNSMRGIHNDMFLSNTNIPKTIVLDKHLTNTLMPDTDGVINDPLYDLIVFIKYNMKYIKKEYSRNKRGE